MNDGDEYAKTHNTVFVILAAMHIALCVDKKYSNRLDLCGKKVIHSKLLRAVECYCMDYHGERLAKKYIPIQV